MKQRSPLSYFGIIYSAFHSLTLVPSCVPLLSPSTLYTDLKTIAQLLVTILDKVEPSDLKFRVSDLPWDKTHATSSIPARFRCNSRQLLHSVPPPDLSFGEEKNTRADLKEEGMRAEWKWKPAF